MNKMTWMISLNPRMKEMHQVKLMYCFKPIATAVIKKGKILKWKFGLKKNILYLK